MVRARSSSPSSVTMRTSAPATSRRTLRFLWGDADRDVAEAAQMAQGQLSEAVDLVAADTVRRWLCPKGTATAFVMASELGRAAVVQDAAAPKTHPLLRPISVVGSCASRSRTESALAPMLVAS